MLATMNGHTDEYAIIIHNQTNHEEKPPSSHHQSCHPLKNIMCFVGIRGVVRGITAPGRFPCRDGSAASSRLEASRSERNHLSTTLSSLRPCCSSATSLAGAPAHVYIHITLHLTCAPPPPPPGCAAKRAIWQEAWAPTSLPILPPAGRGVSGAQL